MFSNVSNMSQNNDEEITLNLSLLPDVPQDEPQNFETHMRGDEAAAEPRPRGVPGNWYRHPREIQLLIHSLVENRDLNEAEHEQMMAYLQKMRQIQDQHKQAELKSRQMQQQEKPPTSDVTPPVKKNSAQAVLDSL